MKKEDIRRWLKVAFEKPFDQSVDAFKDLLERFDKDDSSGSR